MWVPWSTRPYCGHFGTIRRIQKNHKGGHRQNLVHLTFLSAPSNAVGVPTAKLLKDMAIGQGGENEGRLYPGLIIILFLLLDQICHVFFFVFTCNPVTGSDLLVETL